MCLLKRLKTIIATYRREPSQISAQVSGVWIMAIEEMSFQASLLPKLLFIQDAPFKLQLNPSENCEVMMEKRLCHPYYRTKQYESTHRRTQDQRFMCSRLMYSECGWRCRRRNKGRWAYEPRMFCLPSSIFPKELPPLDKWMKRKLTCRLVNVHVVKKNVEQVWNLGVRNDKLRGRNFILKIMEIKIMNAFLVETEYMGE